MEYTKTKTKKIMRVATGLALVTLLTVGGLFANALFAQRDFSGNLRFELCQADANGKWKIIDTVDAPTSFTASVAELAGGNEVVSNTVWSGSSANGRKLSVRLLRAGKAAFDLKTGKLVLSQMPFEVTINGQKELVSYNLTTESVEGATGLISGKRAVINGKQATVALVGSTKLRTNKLAPAGQATIGNQKKVEEFLVVIKANGQVIAR